MTTITNTTLRECHQERIERAQNKILGLHTIQSICPGITNLKEIDEKLKKLFHDRGSKEYERIDKLFRNVEKTLSYERFEALGNAAAKLVLEKPSRSVSGSEYFMLAIGIFFLISFVAELVVGAITGTLPLIIIGSVLAALVIMGLIYLIRSIYNAYSNPASRLLVATNG